MCRRSAPHLRPSAGLAAVAVLALASTACASESSSAGDGGLLSEIQRRGVVRIGIRTDNPPHSFIDASGAWVGFDIDIAHAIADELKVRLEQVKVDELTRVSYLQNGKIDLAAASMSHTVKRDMVIDFSQTYFFSRQTFLVRRGVVGELADLAGQRVGVDRGSSAAGNWRDWLRAHGHGDEPEIVEFSDKAVAAEAVRQGSIAGWAEDYEILASHARNDPSLAVLDGSIGIKLDGIGMRENESDLRDAVNNALQATVRSRLYGRIYDRWFGPQSTTPVPLQGEIELWPNG